MKKIIFLCLLSLSVCLSKPAVDQATPPATVSGTPVDPKAQKTEQTPPVNVTESQNASAHTEQKPPQNTSDIHITTTPPSPPKTTIISKPAIDNKTTDKQTPPKEKEEKGTTTNSTETKVTTEKINPTEKAKDDVSTEKVPPASSETPKTTEAPKSDADKHVLQARGFDGPSFIGGIILTLGLLAIGFMGFKYYKNQTERNYHTL